MGSLFRPFSFFRGAKNTLERRVRSEPEAVVLQQSTVWVRGITWSLMGLSAFALAWLALAKTEEIVTVAGKLEPPGVVKDVQMPVGGVVKSVLIKEGDRVKQGQGLLRHDTKASLDRQRSIRETIRHKQQQLQLNAAELRRSLELNSTEQAMLRRSLALEGEVLQRLEALNR
jgi:HlyD family secretion protein